MPFLDEIIKIARWGEPVEPHRAAHQQQGVRIHPLQAWVRLDGRMLDVALTVREAKNGKFFYDLGAIELGKKRTPPDTSGPPDRGFRITDGEGKAGGTASRRSDGPGQTTHVADADLPGNTLGAGADNVNLAENWAAHVEREIREILRDGMSQRELRSRIASSLHLSPEERLSALEAFDGIAAEGRGEPGASVNLEVRDITPDFSVARAAPKAHEPAPRPEADGVGLDPSRTRGDSGGAAPRPAQAELAELRAETAAHELDIARLEQEGRLAPEDRLELEAARLDAERTDSLEEISLSLVGCVLEAV